MIRKDLLSGLALVVALLAAVPAAASAVPASQPALAVPGTHGAAEVLNSGPGSFQAAAAFEPPRGLTPVGPVPSTALISVAVGLASQDPGGLAAFVAALETPGTPEYRHPLSSSEAVSRFGAPPSSVRAARAYFQSFGLESSTSPDGLIVFAQGASARVAEAFGTSFELYRTVNGRLVYSHTSAATLPAVAAWTGVAGLDNLTSVTPAVVGGGATGVPTPSASCPSSSAYLPCTIEGAYDLDPLLTAGTNGSGERVAVVDAYSGDENQTELASDLSKFASATGTPVGKVDYLYPVPSNVSLNTSTTNPDWGLEEALDLEWARAIAPGATIDMTFSPNAGAGLYEAVDSLVGNGEADVISLSWGEPDVGVFNAYAGPCSAGCNASTDGSYAVLGPVLELAAAEGIGVMAASGDCGAADGTSGVSTNFPASDPYVTGVGATELNVSGTTWKSETAWSGNSSGASSPGCQNQGGSGGGYAPFPRPWWQTGLSSKTSGRGVHDVSLNGASQSPVYVEYEGSAVGVSGTSVATPIWAGIEAIADQHAGLDLGLLGPSLYRILVGSRYASDFHDITVGSNGYPAGVGWDPVTGIGTPNVDQLVSDLARGGGLPGGDLEAYLKVSPTTGKAPLTVTAQPIITGGSGTYPLVGVSFGDQNASLTSGPSVPYTFTTPGVYALQAFAVDSGGNATVSAPVSVVVGGGKALSVALKVSSATPAVGASVTFTATVTGGTSPYHYSFWFGDGASLGYAATAATTHAYATAGSFCAAVTAFDAASPQDGGSSPPVAVAVGGAGTPNCGGPGASSFPVDFSETGLPTGTSWSVTVNGTTHSSTTATIAFSEPNGSYRYRVDLVPGYAMDPAAGPLAVAGSGQTVDVSFARTAVLETLVLDNNTVIPGNFLAQDRLEPTAEAYDAATGEVFVTEENASAVGVVSDATDKLVATVPVGRSPDGIAYDGAKGELFVVNGGSGNVSVLSDVSDSVVATIPVGPDPDAIAWDSGAGELFVANAFSANVSVLSDSSDKVVATVPVGDDPTGVAYDPGKDQVFVTNAGSDNVSVISDAANKVLASVATGGADEGAIAYDPSRAEVFVAWSVGQTAQWAGNVSVIADGNDSIVATVPVGAYPQSAAYDAATGDLLVTNADSGNVSVLSTSTNAVLASVPVGETPWGLAVDPARGELFVSNENSENLSVIADRNDTSVGAVAVGLEPTALAYDAGAGKVFVANGNANNVSVVSTATNRIVATVAVGASPLGLAYDAGTEQVFVANALSRSVSVLSDTTDAVVATVPISGFPFAVAYDPGTHQVFVAIVSPGPAHHGNVSVIADGNDSVVATVPVGDLPVGLAYDSHTHEVFVANQASGTVSVLADSNDTVVATLAVGAGVEGIAYDAGTGQVAVSNSSGSVPSGYLTLLSDATDGVVATVPVGLDPSAVAYDPGSDELFVTNQLSDNVTVVSDTTDQVVATVPVGAGPTAAVYDPGNSLAYVGNLDQGTVSVLQTTGEAVPAEYGVTFHESGLPAGTAWYVNVTGGPSLNATSPKATTYLANGTYSYSVGSANTSYAAGTGSFTVDGAPLSESLTFLLVTYRLTFTETGLAAGTSWSVTLAGNLESSGTSTVVFTVPNGSYAYAVTPVQGYTVGLPGGTVPVRGAGVGVGVVFTPYTYAVTLTESGLPTGVEWWVNVTGGPSVGSTGSTASASLSNGSYTYRIATVDKQFGAPGGALEVNGGPVPLSVAFALVTFAVTFTEVGLPTGAEWWVNVSGEPPLSSTSAVAATVLPNGTYTYTVGWTDRQYSAPGTSSGTLVVDGVPSSRAVLFEATSGSSPGLGVPLVDAVIVSVVAGGAAVGVVFVLLRRRGR